MRPNEYDDDRNEIIIGGASDDDADDGQYDDYARRLERTSRRNADRSDENLQRSRRGRKQPTIEYGDDSYSPRRNRKRRRDLDPEQFAEEIREEIAEITGEAEDTVEEEYDEAVDEAAEEAFEEAAEEAEEAVSSAQEMTEATKEAVSRRIEARLEALRDGAPETVVEEEIITPAFEEEDADAVSTVEPAMPSMKKLPRIESMKADASAAGAVIERLDYFDEDEEELELPDDDFFGELGIDGEYQGEYDSEYQDDEYQDDEYQGDETEITDVDDADDDYVEEPEDYSFAESEEYSDEDEDVDDEEYEEYYEEGDGEAEYDSSDEAYSEEETDYYYIDEDEGFDENGMPIAVVKPRDMEAVRQAREESRIEEKRVDQNLLVSASPHIHCGETTRIIMSDVIIAMVPAMLASTLWFGWRSLMIIAVCVVSCVLTEFISRRVMKRRQTVGDLSAVVTGIILAFCLPPTINPLFAVFGSIVAIAVVKQMFGGIGMNFANPAATARIVMMLSFPVAMTTWSRPFFYYLDAVSEATPLAKLAEGAQELPTYMELLVGYHGGCLGETCAVALLIGGAYLLLRGVITWEIPVCFMGTVMAFSLIVGQDPVYQVLSGGVVLGAVFMATDYVTSPVNRKGKIIFGIGCGLLTMLIRLYCNMPEGVSFAILLMNILTPHIDNLTLSKPFGEERDAA